MFGLLQGWGQLPAGIAAQSNQGNSQFPVILIFCCHFSG
jgi:hypothetical protein